VSSKIIEMEEELRVVGNNLKSLEMSEERALEREDDFDMQIKQLTQRLKEVRMNLVPHAWCSTEQTLTTNLLSYLEFIARTHAQDHICSRY
jgi:hypothetical protein